MIRSHLALTLVAAAALSGCNSSENPPQAAGPALPDSFFVTAVADKPAPIAQLKQTAKAGDEVVVRGHIGGSKNPFVNGRAIMTIVDPALRTCQEIGDPCTTPWDYCCSDLAERKTNTATIQMVGPDGKPLKADLAADPRLPKLAMVVVKGKVAPRTDSAALVIQAASIAVEK